MGGIRRSSEQRPQLEQLPLEADFAGLLPAMLVLVTQRQSRLVPELNEKAWVPSLWVSLSLSKTSMSFPMTSAKEMFAGRGRAE
jgi:hypothetical protein